MGKQKSPEVSVPSYNKPDAPSFSLNGMRGAYDKGTNTYSVSDPDELATMTAVKGLRGDLLKSLGLGGTPESDPYTKQYMSEILRLSQPQTENALIGRGLGGSTVYKDALTDLITKAATQSILGGQQYKTNNYNMLDSYLNNQNTMGMNLLNLTRNSDYQNQQLAQQQYQAMLPLLSKVDMPQDNSGMGGLAGMGALGLLSLAVPGTGIAALLPALSGVSGANLALLGGALGSGIGRAF